jgi:hypothetical protein
MSEVEEDLEVALTDDRSRTCIQTWANNLESDYSLLLEPDTLGVPTDVNQLGRHHMSKVTLASCFSHNTT